MASDHRPWLRAIGATAALWLVTMLVVVIATGALPHGEAVGVAPGPGFAGATPPAPDAAGLELVQTGLARFDALWYLAIASDGYPTTSAPPQAAAFFPGYPLVVAGTAVLLGGRTLLAALLVAFAATVASVVGIERLARHLAASNDRVDGDLPGRTVLLALVFPTSFFLLAPYAESLLLATSVWALVHAVEDRPWTSAALAAAAVVIRPTGALLAVPLVLGVLGGQASGGWWWWTDPARRSPGLRRWVLPALGAGVGLLAIGIHGWVNWGDPLAVAAAQGGWQRELALPWVTLLRGAEYGLRALVDGSTPYHLLDLVVFGLTAGGILALARRREWPLVLHAGASVLLWLSQPFAGRPLMSTPRFALVLPGVMLGLACAASSTWLRRALVPLGGVLFTLHLALFTRWWFVF